MIRIIICSCLRVTPERGKGQSPSAEGREDFENQATTQEAQIKTLERRIFA
jgi:hypothetical protein